MNKKIKKLALLAAALCLLAGCGQRAAGPAGAGELDLDYTADPSGTAREEADNGGWKDFVAGAFSFGGTSRDSGTPDAAFEPAGTPAETPQPDSVQDLYQQGGKAVQVSGGQNAQPSAAGDASAPSSNNSTPQTAPAGQNQETPQPDTPQVPGTSTPEQNAPETPEAGKNTVTMSIRCDTAVANGMHQESKWTGIVPLSGIILDTTIFEFNEGDTVFDVLCQARDTYRLHMQYSGTPSSAYIQGINNLYEFDGGRWSGWMYCVNGWYPNYGCGQYAVKNGDKIEWNYTCDLGLDLNAGMEGAEDWKDTHD